LQRKINQAKQSYSSGPQEMIELESD